MNSSICANDFWPLILKLSPDERLRLARLALRAAVVSYLGVGIGGLRRRTALQIATTSTTSDASE